MKNSSPKPTRLPRPSSLVFLLIDINKRFYATVSILCARIASTCPHDSEKLAPFGNPPPKMLLALASASIFGARPLTSRASSPSLPNSLARTLRFRHRTCTAKTHPQLITPFHIPSVIFGVPVTVQCPQTHASPLFAPAVAKPLSRARKS